MVQRVDVSETENSVTRLEFHDTGLGGLYIMYWNY